MDIHNLERGGVKILPKAVDENLKKIEDLRGGGLKNWMKMQTSFLMVPSTIFGRVTNCKNQQELNFNKLLFYKYDI